MQNQETDFISVQPGYSRALQRLIIFFHLLTAIAIVVSGFTVLVKVMLLIAVVLYFLRMYPLYFSAPPDFELNYDPVQHWTLTEPGNKPEQVALLDSSVSISLLVIIHARKMSGKIRYLLIFYDALPEPLFRRLRVLMRLHHALDREDLSD